MRVSASFWIAKQPQSMQPMQSMQPAPSTPWNPAPAPAGPAPADNAFGNGPAANNNARPPAQIIDGDGPALSFNPSTYPVGGMIDQVWVRFSNGRAMVYDYNGQAQNGPVPVVAYDVQIVDAQTHQPVPGTSPQMKAWTVGNLADFQPKKNGVQFWSPSGKTGFNVNSNWAVFVAAAIRAGVPQAAFDAGQVDSLNGLVAFVAIQKGARGQMNNNNANNNSTPEQQKSMLDVG